MILRPRRNIDDLEDYYLAAEIAERVRKGQERIFTAAEVRKTLANRKSRNLRAR